MRTKKFPYLVNLKSFLKSKRNPSKHMDQLEPISEALRDVGTFEDTRRALC